MLERTAHSNGLVTYQSPLLAGRGVVHAFSTRIGGVSLPPFDSLNLGNAQEGPQDAPGNLEENFRRLQEALDVPDHLRAWVRQVHGRMVELLEPEPENEYAESVEAEIRDRFAGQTAADAMVSTVSRVLLTIRVADCVPILLASADGKIVAAVHAGWRGVIGNIAAKAVRTLHEVGAAPEKLFAAIGPCISLEHFAVGPEVAAEFYGHDLSECVSKAFCANPHVDLQRAVRIQLRRAGMAEERIDGHSVCTYRDQADFFSHRRDQGKTGRLAALIGARR